jgi:DNA replication and repair protein RecF
MLTRLILENFRCHDQLSLDLDARRVLLSGANGQGKTSILEAVYLLSRCRSFRTPRIRECAGWGQKRFGVAGNTQPPVRGATRYKFEWDRAGRQLATDHQENMKLKEFWGWLPVVALANADRQLVTGSGRYRRGWLDGLIAGKDPEFLETSQKILLLHRQKNALLKRERIDRALWDVLTSQMRPLCQSVLESRDREIADLAETIEHHYRHLTGCREQVTIKSNGETRRRLERSGDDLFAWEERSRLCEFGPHREDYDLLLEGKPLRHFGSEGQQKSAVLAMRLAELERYQSTASSPVVFLIDDALIELDARRRERFWGRIPENTQVLFATTDASKDQSYAGFEKELTIAPGEVTD